MLFINLILTCVSLSKMLGDLNSWYHSSHSKRRGFGDRLGQQHGQNMETGRGPVYCGTLGPFSLQLQCSLQAIDFQANTFPEFTALLPKVSPLLGAVSPLRGGP